MSFDTSLARVLKHEGGYVNNPKDPGGETNYGITVAVARAAGYAGPMRSIPMDVVRSIYFANYWQAASCDKLPDALAFQVFDAAVNHGVGNAVRWLQATAGVAVDGKIGPMTLAAVNAISVTDMCFGFLARRTLFYTSLSTFSTFGRGWMNRVALNLDYAVQDT